MADDKSEHIDNTSTSISPLQQNDDVVGSPHALSDTRDVTSLVQSSSPGNVDGSLLNPEVGGQQFSAQQNSHVQTVEAGLPEIEGFELDWKQYLALSPDQTVEGEMPEREGLELAAQYFLAYQNSSAQTVDSGLFPEIEGLPLADQVISGSRGNGLAQSSNASPGPCLKRCTTQPPPITTQAVRSRMHPVVPTSAQAAPLLACPTQTAAFPPPQAQTARPDSHLAKQTPLRPSQGAPPSTVARDVRSRMHPTVPASGSHLAKQTPLRPSQHTPPSTVACDFQSRMHPTVPASGSHLAKETSRLHIPQDLDRKRLRRSMCGLCRKDMLIQRVSPDVTELPCGHRFHTHCLHNITCADQSEKPPCIPCAMREKSTD